MAAGRVVLSQYFPARDRNARLVSGAKLYVYLNGTTTKATIYSDEAMTTTQANPVEANSSGQFPAIWASDATTYTLSITGPDGGSIGNPSVFDNYSVSTLANTESVALAEAAATAAEEALADVLAVQATGDDAAAIAARVPKNTDGSDFSQPTAVLSALGGAAKAQDLADLASLEVANRNLGTFATRALAAAASIPAVLTSVVLRGYSSAGDGGAATYKRASSEPSHAGKFQSADGQWWEIAEPVVTPQMFGAKGDAKISGTGAITSGDNTLTDSSATFTSDDVGKTIVVVGAGAAGAALTTTIASRNSGTSVELTAAASTTVTSATYVFGTDDTDALQDALNFPGKLYIPGRRAGRWYAFDNLTIRLRADIDGDGPKNSVLVQWPTATGSAFTFERGTPPTSYGANDIAEGGVSFTRWGTEVASDVAFDIGSDGTTGVLASMFRTNEFRVWNQAQYDHVGSSPPYTVPSGSIAFKLNGANNGAIFVADHKNLEIRAFETAVQARNVVNEWVVHGWFINCKYSFDLDTISTWNVNIAHETRVENNRMFKLDGGITNLLVTGGRCESSQAGAYMFEFGASIVARNIRVYNTNMQLGDGDAWPGEKYTGTLPDDVIFYLSRLGDPWIAGASTNELIQNFPLRLGGSTLGNGKLVLGRTADTQTGWVENDSSRLHVNHNNGVRIGYGSNNAQYRIEVSTGGLGFNAATPIAKPAVSGSLSTVADAPAKAVLTSLITALTNYGLITNSTT